MGTCPVCRAEHGAGARFCPSCGVALRAVCQHCGETLAPTDVFCSHCGERVDRAVSNATPATQIRESALAGSGEERKLVTILFADVTGSTALADHLDPERLREVLQRYFDAMREEIEAEGGTVEKFIGDAVMAAFGVPTAHEDDPSRALRAADAMSRRLETVNDGLAISHKLHLQMRIGVNTGEVLAATAPEPGAAMVTGDAVNVAARLQTAAGPGEVLVSERTARAARGFVFSARGPLDLRGRREPVRAFQLTGRHSGPVRGVPYLIAPMVGRDSEVAVLDSIYARTVDEGRPHVVTVYGDAGVGKSRLVQEFFDRVQDRSVAPLLLRGRCLPYGAGVTYWPLAEMLKAYAAIQDTDSTIEALAKIDEVTAELQHAVEVSGDAERTAALLAFTVGVPDPRAPTAGMDPQEVQRQLHLAWRTFFTMLAATGPVVVLVEDIHWADPALLDLLDELGERTQGPVLFVYPSRPELVATRPGWGGGRRNSVAVSLGPLTPDVAGQLMRLLLSIDDLPASVHERILERAEGNPFFLEEILRRLIDEGVIFREHDRWRAASGIEEIELPDSVQSVLASRIDLLAAEDKQVLQAAAVVGRVFWREPLQLLTAGRLEEAPLNLALEDSIRRLEERELVSSRVGSAFADQREYIFKHILTRDVAYESIPRRDRGSAHARVARWLEGTAGDRAGEFGELLAYHYSTAADLAKESGAGADPVLRASAVQWLLHASDDARRKYVLSHAELLAHDALALAEGAVETCDALTALGEAYMAGTRGDLAWQYFGRAAAVADASTEIADIHTARLIGQACDLPVRWPGSMSLQVAEPEVRAMRDHGLTLVGTGDTRERANLLAISAAWPFAFPHDSSEPVENYVARGLEAVDVALRLGDADLASACYDAAGSAYQAGGDFRSSMQIHHQRWKLRDRLTQDLEVIDLHAMGAWNSWEIGEYEEAIGYAEAIEHIQHVGGVHAQAWRMAALFRLGRWDEALAIFALARDRLDTQRDNPPSYAAQMYGSAAIVHGLRGDRPNAERLAPVVAGNGIRAYGWRIQLALHRGELDQAKTLLAAPPPAWEVQASVVWEARCDAILTFGEWDRAEPVAADARRYADAAGTRSVIPVADRVAGVAAALAGDNDRAVRLLTTARGGFEDLGIVWEAARTGQVLAAALSRAGRSDEAAAQQSAADRALGALGVVHDRVISAAVAAI